MEIIEGLFRGEQVMKYSISISILVALILAFAPMDSFAQQGQGGARGDRGQQMDRDRSFDRDRMSDRDRSFDRDRGRDQARAGDQTQQRDRDQDRVQDPESMKDEDIYGNELMSSTERNQYRHQLGQLESGQSREQFQAQHETEMQNRALQQGKDLVPPNQGPVYGGEFMSVQERNQYREQLRLMDSDPEKEQFKAQHRERINQRARALGLTVGEAE